MAHGVNGQVLSNEVSIHNSVSIMVLMDGVINTSTPHQLEI